ncbi:hypothetical protein CASFOL_015248 [Castilleja foliolosa]|uniref:Remorin C-terminal domain-containing protein n=1 Tax=Castilleja foliolosa TaxID=1961234 RepID=A0ABD3DD71_9LAMI
MKKYSRPITYSGAHTSPGTPEYDHNIVGETPMSWSSERVPLPTNNNNSTRHINAAVLMPFNSAKALPSKWDNAERWITSPISGDNFARSPITQPQRRPKSKSGPLDPTGLVHLSNYSPVVPALESASFRPNSPFSTGVLVHDGLSIRNNSGFGGKSDYLYGSANDIARSTTRVPVLSDSLGESSMPSSRDKKLDVDEESKALVSRSIYGNNTTTQTSPEKITNNSSSKGRLSFSTLRSTVPVSLRSISNLSAKDEIRDVQVDKGTTSAKPSKRQGVKKTIKDSTNEDNLLPLPWNASEESRSATRLQREEAKITAWENLQKAKAEAAIRKLEMKLEKKRSSSTDKILNELRDAQMRAQAMRNLVSENQAQRAPRKASMGFSCCICVEACSISHRYIGRRN